uniref:Methylated-DNA--protein-cysteine methyltransferase n=1 Tax=Romanomermis culicivorax TaxID=13658 RepID=A0A915IYH3_ROMCU
MKLCRKPLRQYYLQSPVGKLSLTTCSGGLHSLSYVDFDVELKNIDAQNDANLGDKDSFTIRVWKKLLEVPSGQTTTYSELAKNSGNAKASRAVGAAMKRNPCAILVPCHRVLPSHGNENPPLKKQKIGEYANGRNKIKQWLIDFEAKR